MRTEYLECSCYAPEHTLRISIETEEYPFMEVNVLLTPWAGFFRRLWWGVKYIFGKGSPPPGYFDVSVLEREQVKKLRELCDEYLQKTENTL